MHAVIHEIESTCTHGLIPIAGRPLVARQIQWLRSVGCKGIAVQIGASAESVALGQWLARRDAIGTGVRLVMSARALSPRDIARRAGFPDNTPLLAIAADVLCGGDIEAISAHATPEGTVVALAPPEGLATTVDGSAVRMLGEAITKATETAPESAWAIRVRSLADAFTIGVAVLEGRLSQRSENGVLLHASERERGVWASRGAYVDPSAKLIPPVLLGVDTIIRAGATVGPRVFLGDRSVVERNTRMDDTMVAPGTIVGENLALSGIAIDPRGTQDLFTGEHATIDETLLLAPRDKHHRGNPLGRAVALLLLIVMAPIWLLMRAKTAFVRSSERNTLLTLWRQLMEATRGDRNFVGLSEWDDDPPVGMSLALYWKALAAPLGLIRIDGALVPADADAGTRLRARVYYTHEKGFLLDCILMLRALRHQLARQNQRVDSPSQTESPSYLRALT